MGVIRQLEEDVAIIGGKGGIPEVITCKEGDQAQEHVWGYHTGKWSHACRRDVSQDQMHRRTGPA